jgi:hypothetical protein
VLESVVLHKIVGRSRRSIFRRRGELARRVRESEHLEPGARA